jgi:hypothetical protein
LSLEKPQLQGGTYVLHISNQYERREGKEEQVSLFCLPAAKDAAAAPGYRDMDAAKGEAPFYSETLYLNGPN